MFRVQYKLSHGHTVHAVTYQSSVGHTSSHEINLHDQSMNTVKFENSSHICECKWMERKMYCDHHFTQTNEDGSHYDQWIITQLNARHDILYVVFALFV